MSHCHFFLVHSMGLQAAGASLRKTVFNSRVNASDGTPNQRPDRKTFTGYSNLRKLFYLFVWNPGIYCHTASKLIRWALNLSKFRYVIENVSKEQNVRADMFIRWTVRQKRTVPKGKFVNASVSALMVAPINAGSDQSLNWPTSRQSRQLQKKENVEWCPGMMNKGGTLIDGSGTCWIPKIDGKQILRILIAAYTGVGAHRGQSSTYSSVSTHFTWDGM